MDLEFASIREAAPEDPSVFRPVPGLILLDPWIQPSLDFQIRTQLPVEQADQEPLQGGLAAFIRGEDKIDPALKIQRKPSSAFRIPAGGRAGESPEPHLPPAESLHSIKPRAFQHVPLRFRCRGQAFIQNANEAPAKCFFLSERLKIQRRMCLVVPLDMQRFPGKPFFKFRRTKGPVLESNEPTRRTRRMVFESKSAAALLQDGIQNLFTRGKIFAIHRESVQGVLVADPVLDLYCAIRNFPKEITAGPCFIPTPALRYPGVPGLRAHRAGFQAGVAGDNGPARNIERSCRLFPRW